MKAHPYLLSLAGAALLACASDQTSAHLEKARKDYDAARSAPSAHLELTALADAREALNRAEAAHADDPGSYQEKSLAYVASHRARIAMARAGEADARNRVELAKKQADEYQVALLRAQREALQQTNAQLDDEKRARHEAEERARAALASLEEAANVRQDERGTVLTLNGSVLFVTGKSELLPTARERLDAIARSLVDMDSDAVFRIEGHTDSRGTETFNERLSEERARSVADYLVSQGLEQSRVQPVGLGESHPIASNDTPEGRANNRRVEIVIQDPDRAPAGTGTPQRPGMQQPPGTQQPGEQQPGREQPPGTQQPNPRQQPSLPAVPRTGETTRRDDPSAGIPDQR